MVWHAHANLEKPGDGSQYRISDGTSYVVVVFDDTMVERYEQNSSRHFSDLDGGVIGLKNYDLVRCPIL